MSFGWVVLFFFPSHFTDFFSRVLMNRASSLRAWEADVDDFRRAPHSAKDTKALTSSLSHCDNLFNPPDSTVQYVEFRKEPDLWGFESAGFSLLDPITTADSLSAVHYMEWGFVALWWVCVIVSDFSALRVYVRVIFIKMYLTLFQIPKHNVAFLIAAQC